MTNALLLLFIAVVSYAIILAFMWGTSQRTRSSHSIRRRGVRPSRRRRSVSRVAAVRGYVRQEDAMVAARQPGAP